MKCRCAQYLISHPLVPSSMLWHDWVSMTLLYQISLVNTRYWKEHKKMKVQQGSWFPGLTSTLTGNCLVLHATQFNLFNQEKALPTLSENYMRPTFWIRAHHQGWLSTLRQAHTENITNCSEVWTSLKLFLLFCRTLLECTLKLSMGIHSTQKDPAENNPPEKQLAWMSGSQQQFLCSTNLFQWHHNTCQHRHFFHQYPVKTSAPSKKTHRYGTISVSQMFSNTTLAEAKTQLCRLNWMVAAVTASRSWLFLCPRRLQDILQQVCCRQYGSDCFWVTIYQNKTQLMPV